MIRLSVGLEASEDLVADVLDALQAAALVPPLPRVAAAVG